MFDHQSFSRAMKVALSSYLSGKNFDFDSFENWLKELRKLKLKNLNSDAQKMAFWINVYNGFTNLQIMLNGLQKSVWEKPDFFHDRALNIGEVMFSLDDIEHGVLRRNGERRNGKPLQFGSKDPRVRLMIEQFNPRIHFALNCGSISCPPLAFYSAQNLSDELSLAEESFVNQEFLVDHTKKTIECSQLFVWYRKDFQDKFLDAPELSRYRVIERPYEWKIK